ncbi:hypothetical protein DKX38_013552 [Salix brachista]|uniref:Uncharacterized protein n=1 Tax=Salix brachista TaxID=2182728 RepID=A0A5N5LRW8_9ROSI|nr:hypothetical protein DKX38_013552 [Salix brachista]
MCLSDKWTRAKIFRSLLSIFSRFWNHPHPLFFSSVFVANPSKPREVKMILAKNHEKLLELLHNLSAGKETLQILEIPSVKNDDILSSSGAEDEQFEVEKELIIKGIDKLSRRSNLDP